MELSEEVTVERGDSQVAASTMEPAPTIPTFYGVEVVSLKEWGSLLKRDGFRFSRTASCPDRLRVKAHRDLWIQADMQPGDQIEVTANGEDPSGFVFRRHREAHCVGRRRYPRLRVAGRYFLVVLTVTSEMVDRIIGHGQSECHVHPRNYTANGDIPQLRFSWAPGSSPVGLNQSEDSEEPETTTSFMSMDP